MKMEDHMNEDRIKGEVRQVKGSIKEAIGKITGDRKTQAEGAAEKVGGKAQTSAAETVEAAIKTLKNK
jgi:uncharacterized protein YjbJ (UPF0337 family)